VTEGLLAAYLRGKVRNEVNTSALQKASTKEVPRSAISAVLRAAAGTYKDLKPFDVARVNLLTRGKESFESKN
jgi:hypothetical protein